MSVWNNLKNIVHEKYRQKWFESHPRDIAEYSWNYLFTGGKEIRPKLFCELWNYLSPDSLILSELAFAIECIHVASIILDDTPWMDNATERRGRKTLHTVFTPKKAVLISYDLIDMAVDIWKNNKPSHIEYNTWINLLKSKLQRLMIGQWYDLEKTGNLVELASLKTGVLFELVTETVAICVELDTEFWKIIGNNIGILFQWMDDYLDMDEDKVQNNRNAFNESFDITMKNYIYLWKTLEKNMGKQWFEREFGQFMKTYFIGKLQVVIDSSSYSNLSSITINYPSNLIVQELNNTPYQKKYYFSFINGKDMIKHIWSNIDNVFSEHKVNNLWSHDESLWELNFS
jgi:geranylgeranyl pyrophosphate synthase